MGYMCHHAILVTSWDDKLIAVAREKAIEVMRDPELAGDDALHGRDFGQLISPLIVGVVNTETTFVIAPDGSKEGWETSAHGDRCRNAFIEWLDTQRYADGSTALKWALVQYGDDEDDNRLLASDASLRWVR